MDSPADAITIPEDLLALAREKEWPLELLERALRIRLLRHEMRWGLEHEPPFQFERYLRERERLFFDTIRERTAQGDDEEQLVDFYANAAEEVGDWAVTTHRAPYPFAQFRLQERCSIKVLEEQRRVLASVSYSERQAIVGGKRITLRSAGSILVRGDCRGRGYWRLLNAGYLPAMAWPVNGSFDVFRSLDTGFVTGDPPSEPRGYTWDPKEMDMEPLVPIGVYHYPARQMVDVLAGVRPATADDMDRCVALINRTHSDADLFTPSSGERLTMRLEDPCWGEKPTWWTGVYSWPDYYVLEERGEIIACGGMWDRGKHIRESWQHRGDGRCIDLTHAALLDFGYAEGREDAMAQLAVWFLGEAKRKGRDRLIAPIEHLPGLVQQLEPYGPLRETRGILWRTYDPASGDMRHKQADPPLTRPFLDAAYW